MCDQSSESYRAVLSCALFIMLYNVVLKFNNSVNETLVRGYESYCKIVSLKLEMLVFFKFELERSPKHFQLYRCIC